MPDDALHPAMLSCSRCRRALTAGRAELLGYVRWGLPSCCGAEMDLYIRAERPGPTDNQVVALPVALPGTHEDTAIIPVPQPRQQVGEPTDGHTSP